MKKHLFIIGLLAASVALPNMLQAQWTFNVISVTQTGSQFRCEVGYVMVNKLATQTAAKSYPTREQCESNRQWVINSDPECVSVVCGPCTGPGGGNEGGFSNEIGSTNITGTNQGDPFYTPNPYDALTDAYEQKTFQNEKLLGEQGKATSTGDKDFDAKVAKFTGGRPASAEGIFNWLKQRRPLSSNNVKRNRAGGRPETEDGFTGGRPGATGGFNIRPTGSNVANRYNGQRFAEGRPKTSSDGSMTIIQYDDGTGGTANLLGVTANGWIDKLSLAEYLKREINLAPFKDFLKEGVPNITKALNDKKQEINKMPESTIEEKQRKAERLRKLEDFKNSNEFTQSNDANKALEKSLNDEKDPTCSKCKTVAEDAVKKDAAASKILSDI
jgi:hypothetical protein